MRILVIDGQGGNLGRELIRTISARFPDAAIHAVGTNSAATTNMLKNPGITAATGENAVVVGCRTADIIVGPVGIVLADALMGEVTPSMACAVGQSSAIRVLIPLNRCETLVAGVKDMLAEGSDETAVFHCCRFVCRSVSFFLQYPESCSRDGSGTAFLSFRPHRSDQTGP